MSMVGGWVASPDLYRFDSCRALRKEKREASSGKMEDTEADRNVCPTEEVLEALTLLARGLVPKTRGPLMRPGRFDSCSFR
jgi:hypothetical protein